MYTARAAVVTIVVATILAAPALADWDEGDPYKMHWPQLPDLSTTGVDVDNTWVILADDFRCSESGPITDIHIWASWADDILPGNPPDVPRNAGNVSFRLSIHADIPDPDGDGPLYSMPGEELWRGYFDPGGFTWRLYADNIEEWWYDPATGVHFFPGDHQAYQYNFFIPPEAAFYQEQGKVYWLALMTWPLGAPENPTGTFGWKSSLDHFNDDAVYSPGLGGPWSELRYPQQHPLHGQTMDLAFVITPEPATLSLLVLGGLLAVSRRRR